MRIGGGNSERNLAQSIGVRAEAMAISNNVVEFVSSLFDDERKLIEYISYTMIANAVLVAFSLLFVTAPYGRYSRGGWGPQMNAKLAWVVQEAPAFFAPLTVLAVSKHIPYSAYLPNKILLGLYLLHYFQRTFIFSLLIKGGKPTPCVPFAMAFAFCLVNGYMQSTQLLKFSNFSRNELENPLFWIGIAMLLSGQLINIHSDHVLRNLRKPGEIGYKIPRGGMFEYVSGANFLGEIVEWWGFALAGWSLPALAFAVFTTCNIGPRAWSHHQWYKQKFEDYPKTRKAIIPFVL